jgi:hypothetical protein
MRSLRREQSTGLPPTFASNLHLPIRQFVRIERARREVTGQLRAAEFDRSDEAVARTAVLDRRNHRRDSASPYLRRHLAVDSAVGDDFRIPFGDRRKNRHAGTLFGEVDAVCQELNAWLPRVRGATYGFLASGAN